jgi:hypothetical protein
VHAAGHLDLVLTPPFMDFHPLPQIFEAEPERDQGDSHTCQGQNRVEEPILGIAEIWSVLLD